MAFTKTVRKQLDVLTMVAVHRRRCLMGHTAKLMRELNSPSCFAVAAHGSVSCLMCDHNDCIRQRNPELQTLSMLQRVSLPQFFNAVCVQQAASG